MALTDSQQSTSMRTLPRARTSKVVWSRCNVFVSTARSNVDVLLLCIERRHRLKDELGRTGTSLPLLENLMRASLELWVILHGLHDAGRKGCRERREADKDFGCISHDEVEVNLYSCPRQGKNRAGSLLIYVFSL